MIEPNYWFSTVSTVTGIFSFVIFNFSFIMNVLLNVKYKQFTYYTSVIIHNNKISVRVISTITFNRNKSVNYKVSLTSNITCQVSSCIIYHLVYTLVNLSPVLVHPMQLMLVLILMQ